MKRHCFSVLLRTTLGLLAALVLKSAWAGIYTCRTEAVTDCYICTVKINNYMGQWMLNIHLLCFVKSNLNET